MTTRRSRPPALAVKAVQGTLRRMGYELQPFVKGIPVQPRDEDFRRVKLMSRRGITVLLDGGANIGQFALRTRTAGYVGRIVSFEPMRTAFSELSGRAAHDPTWECRQQALGSRTGTSEIHISENSHSSSLLQIEERHLRSAPGAAYIGAEEISVVDLDSVWDEIVASSDRAFLKLDVQGFELEAVRGAARSLPKLAGVETELSLVPLYEGAPTHREVIDHLEAAGFRLAGLDPNFFDPETAELLQADAIFVRD